MSSQAHAIDALPSVLDQPRVARGRTTLIASALVSAFHLAAVFGAARLGMGTVAPPEPVPVTELFDIDISPPPAAAAREPEKQAELAPASVGPVRTSARVAVPRQAVRQPEVEAPPPAAASSAAVLADEVADFGETLIAGKATSYAGGLSAAAGSSTHAVNAAPARASGVEASSGTGGDRSRPPQLAGGASWDCPFPEEASDDAIDHATVQLRIEIGRDGRVLSTAAARDPGHGFGREARRCALAKRWSPGIDVAGKPCDALAIVNVKFDR